MVSSGISDDDDEYEPLIPSAALAKYLETKKSLDLSHRRNKISSFTCYFCPKRKFNNAKAVHWHNKRHHKDVCQQYSFKKWKCLKCNRKLLSHNIRGLIAHVHENRCIRRKHSSSKLLGKSETQSGFDINVESRNPNMLENQTKFLSNLQLIPKRFSGNGKTAEGWKNRSSHPKNSQEKLAPPKLNVFTDDRLNKDNNKRCPVLHKMSQVEVLDNIRQANNEKTPIKFSTSHNCKKSSSHRALHKTNTNVPRGTHKLDETRKKPKPKNLDAEVFCKSFMTTKRTSASKAYEKLCPKTVRRYKRQLKRTKENESTITTASCASEVRTTVDPNGRIVLRCEPSYWSRVKNGEISND